MDIEINKQQQRKGRMIFIMMAIFFIVPIVVVVAMIKWDWRPSGQSRGELVSPPKKIQQDASIQSTSGALSGPFWGDKWNIIYIAETCDDICMHKLIEMRQIYVSTYKDMLRVQRVLITSQSEVSEIQQKFPDMMIIHQPTKQVVALASQFNIANESALAAQRFYFVDPLGHLMMSYKPTVPAADVRKDLVRLLKFSWAG